MLVPKTVAQPSFVIQDGDLLLLTYCDARRTCFDLARMPAGVPAVNAPPDKGAGQTAFVGQIGRKRLVVRTARLDAEHGATAEEMKKAVAAALAEARERKLKRVVVPLAVREAPALAPAAQEGALLGGYVFDNYLAKKTTPVSTVIAVAPLPASVARALRASRVVCEQVNFARDRGNEPPNVCRPDSLANSFRREGARCGLKVSVWDERRLRKERCEGIINVGRGSSSRPRLAIGEYAPRRAVVHLCLVGKGVTFDSGGYCLKPSDGQMGMKYDMSGAAMMWAAACAIARLKLPLRVTVFAPLVENRISDDAYLTSCVLRMRNGTTVEVANTDAEGRLILADALALAAERKPDYLVDAATLTGACVVALGQDIAGAFGTHQDFTRRLIAAGVAEGEKCWELPLHMPYAKDMEAVIADCKNIGSRSGGSINGALFLKKFVPNSIPWVHLDVAGPAGKEDPLNHLPKGAKGFGVKTIVRLAQELARGKR
jgi:leucyl aminopeptidase